MKKEDAVYLRKSRTDMELEEIGVDTLAKHETRLIELADKLNIKIKEENIFREKTSGELLSERTEMQKLLKNIMDEKYNSVLVIDLDRLARGNTKEQGIISEAFKFTNTKIITPNKIYNPNDQADEDFIDFGLFMARAEYKMITRRMKSGKLSSVKNGNFILPYAPFGYDILKVNRNERTIIKNEYAPYVEMIFSWWIDDRLTIGEIAQKLTNMNIPTTKQNKYWGKATIIYLLQNITYTGKIKWEEYKTQNIYENGKTKKVRKKNDDYLLIDGKHEALISEERFELAQSLFNKSSRKNVDLSLKNILSGLLRCRKCNYCLTQKTSSRYAHKFNTKGCKQKSIKIEIVLNIIFDKIEEQIQHLEFTMTNDNKQNEIENQKILISGLKKELSELENQLENICDLFERGKYSENMFEKRSQKIESDITKIKNELFNIKPIEVINNKPKIIKLADVMNALKDDTVSPLLKNNLLKEVIEKIEYNHDEEGLELDIYFL